MQLDRVLSLLALVGLTLGGLLVPAPRVGAAQTEACFAETNQCLRGRFLEYWQQHGGLAINGFPLSPERRELLEDGREYTVQYFERVRLELHPENAPPHDVLLGQFGRRVLRASEEPTPPSTAPVAPVAGQAYFPQTGHNLGGRFREYWEANGGLAQFGYPLTEELPNQRVADFNPNRYTVQYFERARFERHPENAPPYDVLLGQFGRRILVENDRLAREPGFKLLYTADERLQGLLGPLSANEATRAPGAYQAFERGVMLYRGDVQGVYVLCGDEWSGRVVARGGRGGALYFPATWEPGQPPGGGPGPRPGLYEPQRGFGKLWREQPDVRECLGYATTPDETAYIIAAQHFLRGQLLSATIPEGRFIYVVYGGLPDLGGPFYERYPDPAR